MAIDSILQQTYPNLEIIVVDDNSTDHTQKVVKKISQKNQNVKYYSLPFDDPHRCNRKGVNINAGWMARNHGINKTQGEWITFQDADDASLRNRIEAQYQLAQKYNSSHVCIDWQKFDEKLIEKSIDINRYLKNNPGAIIKTKKILDLAKKTKGVGFSLFKTTHQYIPFPIKRRLKLFFRNWDPYPCAAGPTLVKRKIFDTISFRPRELRIRPSDRGRGADRDFNFQVVEMFQDSICAKVPLYLWRVKTQNPYYSTFDRSLFLNTNVKPLR